MRRQADRFLPSRETRRYQRWIRRRIETRQELYPAEIQPGLLSVLTAVWDGSPLRPLQSLAESIAGQNYPCEWVILDNGCRDSRLLAYLKQLGKFSWVKLLRRETNVGILLGLRACLENATGRYVLPVDADDVLYRDALRIVASRAAAAGYPLLLYTDEDKVIGTRAYQPYFKPDWDPVLLLNSAYIAHLGVMDRQRALELGVYSDQGTEGSPDWDAFVRFVAAGHSGVHVPEVVYSWRVHAQSTADDAASKPYVHSSQKAVLRRYLDASPQGGQFEIAYNALFGGGAHFRFVRRQENAKRIAIVQISHAPALSLRALTEQGEFVCLVGESLRIEDSNWMSEAQGLFELHPDVVMIGGLTQNANGLVMDAGRYFGYGGVAGCPYRGKPVSDAGYFGQLWKQRSVSAVSTQFAVVRTEFLRELLNPIREQASTTFLGAWAGAHALRTGKRVVYSPFLSGTSHTDWEAIIEPSEIALFEEANRDLIPDRRFYPEAFSLSAPFELELGD